MIPRTHLFALFYAAQVASAPSRTKNGHVVAFSKRSRFALLPGPNHFYSRAQTRQHKMTIGADGPFSNITFNDALDESSSYETNGAHDRLTGNEIELKNKDDDPSSPTDPSLRWQNLRWDEKLTREQLVLKIHALMAKHLSKCVAQSGGNPESFYFQKLSAELYGFIERISLLYRDDNRYHNWHHACQVTLSASYLVERLQDDGDHGIGISSDPWYPFVASFIGVIHDVKHLGMPNGALVEDNHPLSQVFSDSAQERQSIQAALFILLEEYPTLATEILKGCPTFLKLVNCVILTTDIASKENQNRSLEKYDRVMKNGGRNEQERLETALEQIILFADIAHFSQRYETFLRWGRSFYEECLVNHLAGKGFDPRSNWHDVQIGFADNYILPLAKRCDTLMPNRIGVAEVVERNIETWNEIGREFTEQMIKDTMPDENGMFTF